MKQIILMIFLALSMEVLSSCTLSTGPITAGNPDNPDNISFKIQTPLTTNCNGTQVDGSWSIGGTCPRNGTSVSLISNSTTNLGSIQCEDHRFSFSIDSSLIQAGTQHFDVFNENEQRSIDCYHLQSIAPLKSLSYQWMDAFGEDLSRLAVFGSTGANRADYGSYSGDGNGANRGYFSYDSSSSKLLFERTSTALDGSWSDFTFMPNGNEHLLRHKLNSIDHISLKVKATLSNSSTGTNITTMCGLSFAFGPVGGITHLAGTRHSPNTGSNLNLNNRWSSSTNSFKQPRDFFRILYSPYNQIYGEMLSVDAPFNSFTQASEWSRYTAASWSNLKDSFSIMKLNPIGVANDYLTYRLDLYFKLIDRKIEISITPLASNGDSTSWATETKIWELGAPAGALAESGSERGGLDLVGTNPGNPDLTFDQLFEEFVSIGFVGNLSPRSCEFFDFYVFKNK